MKKLPLYLHGKTLSDQSVSLAEQCAKAFECAGVDASKLFSGLRIDWLGLDKPEYVRLADGEPILNVALLAVAYLTDCYWDVKVQYDQNITGFVWTFVSAFGEPGSASMYPVDVDEPISETLKTDSFRVAWAKVNDSLSAQVKGQSDNG